MFTDIVASKAKFQSAKAVRDNIILYPDRIASFLFYQTEINVVVKLMTFEFSYLLLCFLIKKPYNRNRLEDETYQTF